MTNVNSRSNHFDDHSRISIAQKWIIRFPTADTDHSLGTARRMAALQSHDRAACGRVWYSIDLTLNGMSGLVIRSYFYYRVAATQNAIELVFV